MKKLTLLFVLAFINQAITFSQPCLPEGIIFSTQTQIDSFQYDYPECTEIEGDVWIEGDSISNLSGLIVLTYVGGNFVIKNNHSLTSLTGLNNLTSIGEDLRIINNYNFSLTNLTGLDNLTSIGGNLEIWLNDALTSLTGLDNLTSIGGYLYLIENEDLASLTELNNLTSIGGQLYIYRSYSLTSLTGLDNIDSASIDSLSIFNNSSLSTCDVQSICDYLVNPNATVEIHDNAPGCNSQQEVEDNCANNCLPEGITFSTQAEIDSFNINYPGCTEIEGDVTISGVDITNLNGLSVLTSFGGSLKIWDNPILTNLSGLENITSIASSLSIGEFDYGGNPSLISLTGLENLSSIGGWLEIFGNQSLINLSGLDNLNIIGIGGLWIEENFVLESFIGIENLTNIGGELVIQNNLGLNSIVGLDHAISIDGYLQINNNLTLSTCEVQSICDYLAAPNGTVYIYNNATGCNSQPEVEEACEAIGITDFIQYPEFSIYPNPATNKLFITSKNGLKIETVNIYNQLGKVVLNSNEIGENIDISAIGQGIYIIELTSSELKFRQKLIIEK